MKQVSLLDIIARNNARNLITTIDREEMVLYRYFFAKKNEIIITTVIT